jgi:hypothetical protein
MTKLAPGIERRWLPAPRRARDAPPDLESFADNLYAGMEPLAWMDSAVGYALAHFCAALGSMFQAVEDVARDTPEGPGWSAVLDLDRCPDAWLPWLAQFVGVTVIPGSTPEEQRARIASTDGFRRGTPAAIEGAAAATLTGNQTVTFRERDASAADPPYTLEVTTLVGETPDPAATLAAIIAQKPGGIVLNYRTVTGQDWQGVQVKTWRQARTTYANWRNLRDNV